PIVRNPRQRSDITGDAKVDLHAADFTQPESMHGTVKVDAKHIAIADVAADQVRAGARIDGRRVTLDGRAAAYGAAATASGPVTLPEGKEPLAYDLRGRAEHVDLRRLPRDLKIPAAATNVTADYHVAGTSATGPRGPADVTGDLRFAPSTVAGARIAGGSTAAFTVKGQDVSYRADATVADLDLERVGTEFNVPALATDRYKSTINGHIVASGRGTTPKEMEVTASGTLADASILGGTIPAMTFDAALAHDAMHVKAAGGFAGFDPAVASGKPALKGRVAGTLDVDATVTGVSSGVTPDSVHGRAKVDLQPSTISGLAITQATIDGDYHDSTGEIRTFDVKGPDLNAQAKGTL